MNKLLLLNFLVVLFCISFGVNGQCPSATIPDTICAGEPFDITNTTPGFESYYWDFCTGDLNGTPVGSNIGNPGGLLNAAHQIDIIEDSGNFYGFVANFGTNVIVRLDYGNSPANNPTAVALTVNSLNGPSGIQLYKENGNWYALVANYWTGDVVTFDFGNSITNTTPAVININSLLLNAPFQIKIIKETNNVYAFITQTGAGNLIKLDFGNSITNNSVSTPIFDATFSGPFGVDIIYDCELDKFIGVITNKNNATLSILDFNNSLQNVPVSTSVSNLQLTSPNSVNILRDGTDWHVMVSEETGNFIQINFGISLLNPMPQVIISGPMTTLTRGMEFIKHESTWYGVITNYSGTLFQIMYPDNCMSVPAYSSDENPSAIILNDFGNHLIELRVIDLEGNYNYFHKLITVLEAPNSNYSYSLISCSGIADFIDESTTNSGMINTWFWDFDDGNTSSSASPTNIFTNPGIYNISLTVTTTLGCSDTYTDTLINDKPVAAFSVTDGCVTPPLQFNNTSPDPDSLITSYLWDFGDGSGSTLANPYYTYSSPGTFNVSLIVSIGSCSDTAYYTLDYLPKPQANFSVLNTCLSQQQQFINNSTIISGSIISNEWNFGDGNFSTQINPNHQYGDTGNYLVQLISVANNGCSDTIIKNIRVSYQPSANFSISPTLLCSGTQIDFTDNSIATGDTINEWIWYFGNGDSMIINNPAYTYSFAGNYDVILIVNTGTNCIDSSTQTIAVQPSPVVNYTSTATCFGEATMFTDLSTTASGVINSWYWSFGTGDTSALQNPIYTYSNAGIYPVTLYVTNSIGCFSSDTINIEIYPLPEVGFSAPVACSNKLTQFFDSTTVDSGSIINWSWDFGDPGSGINNYSNLPDPVHFYNLPGSYLVKLVTESSFGCVDSLTKIISINQTPTANFSSSQACDGELVSFTYLDNSFPSNATNWFWNFGNGATSTIDDPATLYLTWGTYQVTLIVEDSLSGCIDTVVKPVDVDPLPVAVIPNQVACIGTPFIISDSSYVPSGIIQEWEWNIGSDTFNTNNPTYTFLDTGYYNISLQVFTDRGCTDSVTKTIYVSGLPTANFSFNPTFGDAPLQVDFQNNALDASNYFWNFGDGTTSDLPAPLHVYNDTGTYDITFIAINSSGCRDSIIKSIHIIQPRLDLAVIKLHPVINNSLVSLSVEISNFGTREVNSFNISAQVNGGSTIVESWNGSIKSGQTILYNFNAAIEVSNEPEFICTTVNSPNGETDDNQLNNSRCESFVDAIEIFSIFPNPSKDIFNIQFNLNSNESIHINIYDSKGSYVKNIFSGWAQKGYNSITFSSIFENLRNGMYVIELVTSNKNVYHKFSRY